jgi:hypothetical protein
MEGGIFLCHWYFLTKAWLRKRRQEDSPTTDEEAGTPKPEGSDVESEAIQRDHIPLNPIFSSTSHEERR